MKLKYLKQTNKFFNTNINDFSCYFFSILIIIEEETRKEFTHEYVIYFYNLFLKNGWIDSQCTVLKPNEIFAYFGIEVTTVKADDGYILEDSDLEFVVIHIELFGGGRHFILAKAKSGERITINHKYYDSLGLDRNDHKIVQPQEGTNLHSFRIFKKKIKKM